MKEKTSTPVIHEESKRLTSVYCEVSVLDTQTTELEEWQSWSIAPVLKTGGC
jgi:hypothetical protein